MSKVITFISTSEKSGKTCTIVNLSTWLALLGNRVLIIDSSSDARITNILAGEINDEVLTLDNILIEQMPLDDAILETSVRNLFLIPTSKDNHTISEEVFQQNPLILRDSIDILETEFDYIFLDFSERSPSSFQACTAACDKVVVVLNLNIEELEKVSWVIDSIVEIKSELNKWIEIDGILINNFVESLDMRQALNKIKDKFKDLTFKTILPKNNTVAEAFNLNLPISLHDMKSFGAESYLRLAREFISKHEISVK
jgi:chromosome partitioning protein